MYPEIYEKENTQLMYTEGLRCNKLGLLGPAIKAYKQSINRKERDSCKACYELSKIYAKLEDLASAYQYCEQAIQLNSQYIEPLYYLAHILNKLKVSSSELEKRLESIFYSAQLEDAIVAHIFYMEGFYKTALRYIGKYESEKQLSDDLKFLRIKCLIRSSRYIECFQFTSLFPQETFYFFKAMMYRILCLIITDQYESIGSILNMFNEKRLSSYNKKAFSVYTQFYNLVTHLPCPILCENENDVGYTECIFEICDILLVNKEFEIFEVALNLFNLISDKTVLLQLGKLYYKYGYFELSKKEILRSLKLFEIIDIEGIEILKHIDSSK